MTGTGHTEVSSKLRATNEGPGKSPEAIEPTSFVVREIAWDDGARLYAIAIDAPAGVTNLEGAQVSEAGRGYVLTFDRGRHQVGSEEIPIPRRVMRQSGGVDVFLVGEGGHAIDAIRVAVL